ncbi:MAG TPA: 2-amino-4-hydroxy-6-hydroxymethyldihydropteridine diphosphokinase [Sediminibacterium sp.]|nr:2-amino-4-hydroxy-6-hydroxymethyldihydropteridine diphosphokinase [Sediminibacterium sp.]
MNHAFLLAGSNMGNRYWFLNQALEMVTANCGKLVRASSIYETAAWGLTEQPAFLNQALEIETTLLPEQLLTVLLQIETSLGRIRTIKMGPRTIDLDILLIDQLVIQTPQLVLPHPALPFRRFALLPLFEIAPTLLHPVSGKSITNLLQECTDPLDVQKKSGAAG